MSSVHKVKPGLVLMSCLAALGPDLQKPLGPLDLALGLLGVVDAENIEAPPGC